MTVVSTLKALLLALASAAPGDTIELAPGDYADLVLDRIQFARHVTIKSQRPDAPARFRSLSVKHASHLTFDRVVVNHVLAAGAPDWSSAFRIDKSDNISILNSEISGSADGIHTNDGQGLLVLDSSGVTVRGNSFHDLKTGLSIGRSQKIDVTNNSFFDIRSDGADFANVRHVTVDGNSFANFHTAIARGDHPDMIQLWNDGSNGEMFDIAITNNKLSQGRGGNVQGIFIQGSLDRPGRPVPSPLHDIQVSGNTIEVGSAQGIWMSHVKNARITSNTVTKFAGGSLTPSIRTDHTSNTIIERNTAPRIDDVGSTGLSLAGNTVTAGATVGSRSASRTVPTPSAAGRQTGRVPR